MSKIIFDLDMNKCSACGACAVACMDQNDLDVSKGQTPFRVVCNFDNGDSEQPKFTFLSLACMHCEDAPCIMACPSACLYKDPDTNLTVYNTDNCIGCHSCAMACPFGVPSYADDGKLVKCDGCVERIKWNLEPACVLACPTLALRYYTSQEEYDKARRDASLRRLSERILNE